MTHTRRPTRTFRVSAVTSAALLVLVVVSLTFGVTGALTIALPVGLGVATLAIAASSVYTLRHERLAHEAALTEWAATEAVLAERLHIARDLHDLVSNGLGMITVRAATAQHLDRQHVDPTGLREAIADIEALSRDATQELRRMLGVLRATDQRAPRAPADRLVELPGIVAAAQRGGLDVTLTVGGVGDVSSGAQLVVVSVVREALANVARHAGPAQVAVTVRREATALTVNVADSGPRPGWLVVPGSGHGLRGLRERLLALGGELRAGPRGDGFELEATIPDEAPA